MCKAGPEEEDEEEDEEDGQHEEPIPPAAGRDVSRLVSGRMTQLEVSAKVRFAARSQRIHKSRMACFHVMGTRLWPNLLRQFSLRGTGPYCRRRSIGRSLLCNSGGALIETRSAGRHEILRMPVLSAYDPYSHAYPHSHIMSCVCCRAALAHNTLLRIPQRNPVTCCRTTLTPRPSATSWRVK